MAGEDGFVESSVKAAQDYLASPDRTKHRKAPKRFAGQVRAGARIPLRMAAYPHSPQAPISNERSAPPMIPSQSRSPKPEPQTLHFTMCHAQA